MKFIRNARLRDRIVDILSKALLVAISALACLWMVSGAHAARSSGMPQITGITTQPQPDGSYTIDFSLSQTLEPGAVSVDFERNFIQLSLQGVSAYPARTESINQASLEKVFTYQYQPDLARARVLLKSAASAIKDKASWEVIGKSVRITVKGQAVAVSDSLQTTAASTSSADTEEDRIVQEILNETNSTKAASIPAATAASAASAKKAALTSEETPLFSTKSNSADGVQAKDKESPATRIFASLLLVIGIIGASAVAYRRFALGKGLGLPFQKQPKVIDVISTQALGPKRSVALIKVLDQYMVVGMAGDGMSLLANLGSDVKIEKFIDQTGPGASFSDAFDNAMAGDIIPGKLNGTGAVAQKSGVGLGIRSSIKKRMEGFKPL